MLISRTDLLDTSEKAMLLLLTFCMVPQKLDTQSRGLPVRQTWMPLDVAFRFKSGPKRSVTCLVFLFLAFIATTLWAIHHEGHLMPFLRPSDDDDDFDEDDVLRALVKLSAKPQSDKPNI